MRVISHIIIFLLIFNFGYAASTIDCTEEYYKDAEFVDSISFTPRPSENFTEYKQFYIYRNESNYIMVIEKFTKRNSGEESLNYRRCVDLDDLSDLVEELYDWDEDEQYYDQIKFFISDEKEYLWMQSDITEKRTTFNWIYRIGGLEVPLERTFEGYNSSVRKVISLKESIFHESRFYKCRATGKGYKECLYENASKICLDKLKRDVERYKIYFAKKYKMKKESVPFDFLPVDRMLPTYIFDQNPYGHQRSCKKIDSKWVATVPVHWIYPKFDMSDYEPGTPQQKLKLLPCGNFYEFFIYLEEACGY